MGTETFSNTAAASKNTSTKRESFSATPGRCYLEIPSSEEILAELLSNHDIDPSGFGKGKAKTLGHLLKELEKGESRLQSIDSKLSRQTSVVSIRLNILGHVLVQTSQELEDGRTRSRGKLVAKKMAPNETQEATVRRALSAELGLEEANYSIEIDTWLTSDELEESPSYPGLASEYRMSRVDVTLDRTSSGELVSLGINGGRISEHEFKVREEKEDGKFITTTWLWVPRFELNPHINLPLLKMDASLLDMDEDLHAVRDVVEIMITQFYKEDYKEGRISRIECKQLIGGFSGSILMLVKSFDKDENELDPKIMKFDDRESLSEEFECYEKIQKYIPRCAPVCGTGEVRSA